MELIGHIVDPAHAPRVTAHDPPRRQNNTFYRAVFFYRVYSISRAGRIVFTTGSFKRRKIFFIKTDEFNEKLFHCTRFISFESFPKKPSSSVDFLPMISPLATMTISYPRGSKSSFFRYAARIILFARLRSTAPPTFLPAVMPKRLYGRRLAKKYATTPEPEARVPFL